MQFDCSIVRANTPPVEDVRAHPISAPPPRRSAPPVYDFTHRVRDIPRCRTGGDRRGARVARVARVGPTWSGGGDSGYDRLTPEVR